MLHFRKTTPKTIIAPLTLHPQRLAQVIGLSATLTGAIPAAATAQGENGERARISAANEIRTDVQRVAVAACYLTEEIKTDISQEALTYYLAEFDLLVDALRNGSDTYGIPTPEERARTLRAIDMLQDAWVPMRDAAAAIRDGADPASNLAIIAAENPSVLEASERLVAEITGQYFNPAEMVKADSLMLEIASRQRKLILQMSKQSCLMRLGLDGDDGEGALTQKVQIFDASLQALLNGMESAGIRRPPTPEIAGRLAALNTTWATVKPVLEQMGSGTAVTGADADEKVFTLYTMGDDMSEIVALYEAALAG